jgi:hypothetical protein
MYGILDAQPSEHIYGGSVERDRYGYVEFVDMQSVLVLFNEKASFRPVLMGFHQSFMGINYADVAPYL